MKLGDIWVRLGLKKDDFSKGVKEAGNELNGTNGLLAKIKSLKAGAIAAYAAIAAGAIKMADSFAHTSQRLGDKWDQVTSGLKASWRTFISAVNSADFSNLGKRLSTAFKNAREIAASKDQEFEVMNAIELEKSKMDKELEYLRIQMTNQKLTSQQRIDAANQYLSKLKGVYDKEEDYRRKHAEKVKKAYLEDAQLANSQANSDYLEKFLMTYAEQPEVLEALDHFARNNATTRKQLLDGFKQGFKFGGLSSGIAGAILTYQAGAGSMEGLSQEDLAALQKIMTDEGENGLAALAAIAKHYQETGDKEAKEVVDAIVKANYAAGAFDKETRRVQTVANQANGGDAGNTRFAAATKIAERAANAGKSALQVLNETYEQEKKLLQSFGMDTTALTEEFMKNMAKLIDVPLQEMQKVDDLVVDLDFELDEDPVAEFVAQFEKDVERMEELVEGFKDACVTGLSDSMLELTDQLAGVAESNPGAVFQALLDPLADLAMREGEILVATGMGVEACKKALESLNGYAAIAAGVALIGLGAAAKSGLAALAKSGASTTSATTYSGSGGNNLQTVNTELTVNVKGTIRGSDIVLSGQRTVNNWGR